MMSGGPIQKFTEGWAVKVFGFGKGHYFKRNGVGLAKPVCGGSEVAVSGLREIGTWKTCERCEKIMGAPRTLSRHVDDKAVQDFTRVCEQAGLIDKLRKE